MKCHILPYILQWSGLAGLTLVPKEVTKTSYLLINCERDKQLLLQTILFKETNVKNYTVIWIIWNKG